MVRRIVTSEDASGRSYVLTDGPAPVRREIARGLAFTELWETGPPPACLPVTDDVTLTGKGILDAAMRGTSFSLMELPPDEVLYAGDGENEVFAALGGEQTRTGEPDSPQPGMHKTDTINYLFVVSGEVHLILDTGEVLLRAGDVLVQCGANHAWSNRSGEPCVLAGVTVPAVRGTASDSA